MRGAPRRSLEERFPLYSLYNIIKGILGPAFYEPPHSNYWGSADRYKGAFPNSGGAFPLLSPRFPLRFPPIRDGPFGE